jgi:hypothetical protein
MKSKEPAYRARYWKSWAARNRPRKIKQCLTCGVEFAPDGTQRRCDTCRTLTCLQCGREFISPNANLGQIYCTRVCKDASLRGSEPTHLAANRGRKPRTYHLRHREKHGSQEDRDWRKMIFERDNYTCQICSVRGGQLQADHIKPFKAFPELRHVLANGRTLCVACHRKTETYGWSAYWRRPEIAAKRLSQGVLNFQELEAATV